jgi:hypothetical protein
VDIFASFLLSVSLALQATPAAPPAGNKVPVSEGTFFALSVADSAAMAQWYQEKLGLRILSSGEAPNKIAKFALLEGKGILIELIQHSKASARSVVAPSVTDPYQIHGIFKVGLIVSNLDEVYAGLKRQNVPIAYDLMPAKDVPMRSFSVRDPEGNLLQFFGR